MVSVQRRINSTGRKRITRDHINIELEQPADIASFPWASATVNLQDLDLPVDAHIALEAYYRSSSMRFACGTVASPNVPARMIMTDIDRGGAIQFRVLIIAPDNSGRILASAEGLRPAKSGEGPDRQPLLPLRETNLGSELWRIDVDHRVGATLLVNNAVPGLAGRIRTSPLIQGLVLPHAFRIILMNLSAEGEEEGDEYWGNDWRKFLKEIGVPTEPEDDDPDTIHMWIETAVEAFCDMKDFASRVRLDTSNSESIHD
jgi:hypothetical protein